MKIYIDFPLFLKMHVEKEQFQPLKTAPVADILFNFNQVQVEKSQYASMKVCVIKLSAHIPLLQYL